MVASATIDPKEFMQFLSCPPDPSTGEPQPLKVPGRVFPGLLFRSVCLFLSLSLSFSISLSLSVYCFPFQADHLQLCCAPLTGPVCAACFVFVHQSLWSTGHSFRPDQEEKKEGEEESQRPSAGKTKERKTSQDAKGTPLTMIREHLVPQLVRLMGEKAEGHVLVFLPGQEEIGTAIRLFQEQVCVCV